MQLYFSLLSIHPFQLWHFDFASLPPPLPLPPPSSRCASLGSRVPSKKTNILRTYSAGSSDNVCLSATDVCLRLITLLFPRRVLQMRKLQENERNRPMRSAPRVEKRILTDDDHTVRSLEGFLNARARARGGLVPPFPKFCFSLDTGANSIENSLRRH